LCSHTSRGKVGTVVGVMNDKPLIFDVEGTLIDCVEQTISCWMETLHTFRCSLPRHALQAYSGCDGQMMLEALLPTTSLRKRQEMLAAHEELYEGKYLQTVGAFEGVHDLFQELSDSGCRLALATTCKESELAHYDRLLDIVRLCAAVEDGSQVKRGKPHPDLLKAVLRRLGAAGGLVIGDTPYDAQAATACGLVPLGVLSGGFSESALRRAGCVRVWENVAAALESFS
jgi:HAD superfamily hydrolase (TIGR01549 family)